MPLCTLTNEDAFTQTRGMVIRAGAAPGGCVAALADTVAHTERIYGFRNADVTASASGTLIGLTPLGYCRMETEPNVGDLIYLSATSLGLGTPTAPVIQKLLGLCALKTNVGGVWFASLLPEFQGSSLALGYEVDFSTLPAADLRTGDGVKTIDGKPWSLGQQATSQTVYLNDGTHTGLYLRCSTDNTDDFETTYNCPRLIVGLTDLTGIKPQGAAEVWVLARFDQPHEPDATYEFGRISILQMPTDPTDTTATYRRVTMARGYTGAIQCSSGYRFAGTQTNQPTGTEVRVASDDVYAFRILNNQRIEAYSGASVGGVFPAIASLKYIWGASFLSLTPGFDTLSILGSSASNDFQWAMEINASTGNTAGASDFLLQNLAVYYR